MLPAKNLFSRAAAISVLNETAHEFKAQGIESVKFYHIDGERNELWGISLDGHTSRPVFVFWPAGDERRPLMFRDADVLGVMSGILSNGKTNLKKFKVPTKYDEGSLEL